MTVVRVSGVETTAADGGTDERAAPRGGRGSTPLESLVGGRRVENELVDGSLCVRRRVLVADRDASLRSRSDGDSSAFAGAGTVTRSASHVVR
ncbi:hypothetical protein [Natrinema salaciae]|uniref:hypothetical protein n=1 Tax=Natrinema salaciae TaxID=1186196 RepID=UPI000B8A2344|nr:hypothetical protein [Natrinema salaciae]